MLKQISKRALSIEIAATKKIEIIARSYDGVISLAQGIPSFPTAPYIKEAAKKAIDEGLVDKYSVGFGIEPLRVKIAEKVNRENNIKVKPSEIIVTHGAIEGLMAIFLAILDEKDELIVLTPNYASHLNQIQIALGGKKAVPVVLDETKNEWTLNPQRLEKAVTKKTKAILICNPCNPTGKVYTKKELKEIARIAKKYNLYIITDEMYEYFVFDKKEHISIGSFPEVSDRTISVFGFSKSYAMTGWRIGYITARQYLIDQIFKIHDSLITCPNVVAQYAALSAIEGTKNVVELYKKAFIKRREIVINELSKTNKIQLITPNGAYYAFPKILLDIDDNKLTMQLIKEAKVAVIPGSAFGKGGEKHIRISFGQEENILREGLQRLTGYLNNKF